MGKNNKDGQSREINKHIKLLDKEIKELRDDVLQIYSHYSGKPISVQKLNGMIGGMNDKYADCVNNQYNDYEEFIACWLKGFNESKGGNNSDRSHPLFNLLKDELFTKYVFLFLERNFYKNINDRTRPKPRKELWSCWFGDNKLYWGLLIAPKIKNNEWVNDVSEIRRAKYYYWTIGHIMETGFVDLENNTLYKISDLQELYKFIENILKRLSSSKYEKDIFSLYVKYLKDSENIKEEPFLIPEFRYAGSDKDHKYRLDFLVLNSYTMEFTGFELSPQSTHMAVKGIRSSKQSEWNKDLENQWRREMDKRNAYYSTHGISIITFTDEQLKDTNECFSKIRECLEKRREKITKQSQLDKIRGIKFI